MLFKNRQLIYEHLLYYYTYVMIILDDSMEVIHGSGYVYSLNYKIYPKSEESVSVYYGKSL